MTNFKKGDVIVLENAYGMSALEGAKAMVVKENYNKKYKYDGSIVNFIDIKWIDKKSKTQMNGAYYPDIFNLYKPIEINENSTELEHWLNLLR